MQTPLKNRSDTEFDFDSYGMTFLARHLHRLRVVISDQSDEIFEDAGIIVPSHCSSLVLLLEEQKEVAIVKIANALGYSHQLVNQRVAILEELACVQKVQDPGDRRRSLVQLTRKGRSEAKKMRAALQRIDAGIQDVLSDLDVDLPTRLVDLRASLLSRSLLERSSKQA